jgi:hypothetical protein
VCVRARARVCDSETRQHAPQHALQKCPLCVCVCVCVCVFVCVCVCVCVCVHACTREYLSSPIQFELLIGTTRVICDGLALIAYQDLLRVVRAACVCARAYGCGLAQGSDSVRCAVGVCADPRHETTRARNSALQNTAGAPGKLDESVAHTPACGGATAERERGKRERRCARVIMPARTHARTLAPTARAQRRWDAARALVSGRACAHASLPRPEYLSRITLTSVTVAP